MIFAVVAQSKTSPKTPSALRQCTRLFGQQQQDAMSPQPDSDSMAPGLWLMWQPMWPQMFCMVEASKLKRVLTSSWFHFYQCELFSVANKTATKISNHFQLGWQSANKKSRSKSLRLLRFLVKVSIDAGKWAKNTQSDSVKIWHDDDERMEIRLESWGQSVIRFYYTCFFIDIDVCLDLIF